MNFTALLKKVFMLKFLCQNFPPLCFFSYARDENKTENEVKLRIAHLFSSPGDFPRLLAAFLMSKILRSERHNNF